MFSTLAFVLYLSGCSIDKAQYPLKYENFVDKYSAEYGVNDELIYAIIKTESNFEPNAESSAGAVGLMQLMPETFEWLQSYYNGEVTMYSESLYEPETSIKYGTMFLGYLLSIYGSSEETAVAAYNAGVGAVNQWLSDPECSNDGTTLYYIPYDETRAYVQKVENAKKNYKDVYGL